MRQSNIVLALLQGYVLAVQVQDQEPPCDNDHIWIGNRMVTYKQMKEEVESTAVGFAVGICPDNDCPTTE